MLLRRPPDWPNLRRLAPAACLWLTVTCGPATAQSFLEQLFGLAKPHPMAAVPPVVLQSRPSVEPSPASKPGATILQTAGSTYRTVCVRMCDGFFVPVSFSTRRDSFQHDQAKCRATCGDDARLFVYRNPGETIDDAVDLAGRPYNRLPHAFRFRKARVEGCACRPPPWSEAEIARHRSYAAAVMPSPPNPASTSATASAALTPSQAAALALEAKGGNVQAEPSETDLSAGARKGNDARVARADKASRRSHKVADHARNAQPLPSLPIKLAAAKPQPVPPSSGGLFGSSAAFGLGLASKPKYIWPGD